MQPTFLGKVAVAAAGTPTPVTKDASVLASKIVFAAIPGLTGAAFVGSRGLNQQTLSQVMIKFPAPAGGDPEPFVLDSGTGENTLHVSDYLIDASVNGEGLLVTYFQS